MRKIVINIDEKDFEIISNKVKDIRDEISNNGYANHDFLPIGWTSIADGIPLEDEFEKIKTEIQKKYPYTLSFDLPKKKIVIDCIDILDNHISELKGEHE